ncbi:MAG: GNAT family N-acetyltransferase [Methylococcaceae bacterium]|nr:GNAT family N-acetyltransferase [Methylococcaceae bacterium]MDZ4157394.1 GNAT family N-acetyltransferase [Methylococcales bacterium]MDP2392683.1 GNAT family N-acetyltransferase [Methylococcaceae bacterium]MDP3021184.1 GNAT family N-acetyltransferase [Methylococcaceae bacterium]MDP3390131.1 GNAT family N-acetyltransferase [Methylococcaceae bacterium]
MQITPAKVADIPALCELLHLLFSQEADFTPDDDAQRRGLTRIINSPDIGLIIVARQDGQVVGMVSLLYTISTALGERVALLEDMVVISKVRRTGVGSKLLQQAIKLARLNGCKRITLLTDAANKSAQRFYQRHGFDYSAMIPLRLSLSE